MTQLNTIIKYNHGNAITINKLSGIIGRSEQSLATEVQAMNLPHKVVSIKDYKGNKQPTIALHKPALTELCSNLSVGVKEIAMKVINSLQSVQPLVKVEVKAQVKAIVPASNTDFRVNPDGTAYVSQRKTAELCGVRQNSVVHFFKGKSDISQGVNSENLQSVVQNYMQKGKPEAIETGILLMKGGAQAFIYHGAGLKLGVSKPEDNNQLLLANDTIKQLESDLAKTSLATKFLETVMVSDDLIDIPTVARRLGIGRNSFYNLLRNEGILAGAITGKPNNNLLIHNQPYQKFINSKYFVITTAPSLEDNCTRTLPKVTGKGFVWLTMKFGNGVGQELARFYE